MEPQPPQWHSRATLVDLLDRILDKGLFLRADLIVSLAGIPLIGVTLSLAVAGTETMLKYGVMTDWDRDIRALAHCHAEGNT
jgi:gas vesicle structural protein